MSKKSIIVFEGVEGTGKSHHINKVSIYLKKKKKKLIKIKKQGGKRNFKIKKKL